MRLLDLHLSLYFCLHFSSPSRTISAAEAPRWGYFEDFLLLTGAGPMPGSLCLQKIQPASKRSHPLVSNAEDQPPACSYMWQSLKITSWGFLCMWLFVILQETLIYGCVWVYTSHDASWARQVLPGQPWGVWTPKPLEGELPAASKLVFVFKWVLLMWEQLSIIWQKVCFKVCCSNQLYYNIFYWI